MEKTEIYVHKPIHADFSLAVAGAVIMHDNRFLLLKRHPEKSFGDHWNLPAGKVEEGEDPQSGAQREIYEETGIFLTLENLELIQVFYMQRGSLQFQFHVFKARLESMPNINLKLDENTEALWVNQEEANQLRLISGGSEIIDVCLKAF